MGKGLQNAGFESEEVEFALAFNVNEAGRFELLDVVREGGGGNGEGRTRLRATEWAACGGDFLQELKPARVGQGFENGVAPSVGETDGFCGRPGWCS